MGQADIEVQLQVWKDLAISKQVLMGAATDALGLDPDCSSDELKVALSKAIKRAIEADADIKEAREKANTAIAVMNQKVEELQRSLGIAETEKLTAESNLQKGQEQMAAARTANAEELKKVKAQLVANQKELKAINVALADTPENVLKKMKTLKKQKMDEAAERKRLDGELTALKKEKQELDKNLAEAKAKLDDAAKLAAQHRDLHAVSLGLREQLAAQAGAGQEIAEVPLLDEAVLSNLEAPSEQEEAA